MFQRILVPLDGSTTAERILPYAIDLARRYRATLVLLRAGPGHLTAQHSPNEPIGAVPQALELAERVGAAEATEARHYLVSVGQRLQAAGIAYETLLPRGDVPAALIAAVREEHIDLVAMATHGRSALGRLVFGSTAEQVLQELAVPSLLLHAED